MKVWFDKPRFFLYTIDMKRRTLCIVLFITMLSMPLFALPVSSELALGFHGASLPVDEKIGQLVEANVGSVEDLTIEALSTPYSLEWVEKYVPKDIQFGFVHTFDAVLSSLLPQRAVSTAKAIKSQEMQQVSFRFRVEETGALHYGTFVWIELEEGVYNLISITLEP